MENNYYTAYGNKLAEGKLEIKAFSQLIIEERGEIQSENWKLNYWSSINTTDPENKV